MKLIIGLGNPGKEYDKTRHNIGFMTLDSYISDEIWKNKFDGLFIKHDDVIFLKPQTYMNNSGFCVKRFVDFYKIKIEDIMVVQDDLDLKFGDYKLKNNSSAGGHNGIKSIINCLGSNCFGRLKIGIAHDRSIDTKDYVLSKFSNDNILEFSKNVELYKEIITFFIENNIEKTISKYNALR